MTRASVLIPAHNKPTTLPLAVDTALRQSVRDLEVIVIGDGVTDDVRRVVDDLRESDGRVRFLDFPKGPHHGEVYRHDAVQAATSDAIFYLCDDDLLLPDHVADLLALLEDATFVQSFNGFLRGSGEMGFYPSDLSNPRTIELLRDERLRFNTVSITGTAHSRRFYDRVGDPWDTTPDGLWPDLHQWRKLMAHSDFRGATSGRMTALQFPSGVDGRSEWTAERRGAELESWHRIVTGPEGQATIDDLVHRSALGALGDLRAEQVLLRHKLATARSRLETERTRLETKNRRLKRLRRALRERVEMKPST